MSNEPISNQPDSSHEGAVYTGHLVIDELGTNIGKVTDVVYDEQSDQSAGDAVGRLPDWLVVDPGMLRAAHYMPVAGSYRTADGTIVAPWDKDRVKSAVKASTDHIITREQREQLLHHYALAG